MNKTPIWLMDAIQDSMIQGDSKEVADFNNELNQQAVLLLSLFPDGFDFEPYKKELTKPSLVFAIRGEAVYQLRLLITELVAKGAK